MTTKRFLSIPLSLLCLISFAAVSFTAKDPAHSFGLKKNPAAPAASEAAEAPAENMEIRDKWAIVVGINKFADTSIPPLKLAQKSSADVARALKDADFGHFGLDHVLVVNGVDASKAGIEQAFNEWLFKKALPNDLVVIYFNSRILKNLAGDPVICANDTRLQEPDRTAINLQELLKTARQRIGSTHILCMLDTNPVGTEKGASADSSKPGVAGASAAGTAESAKAGATEAGKAETTETGKVGTADAGKSATGNKGAHDLKWLAASSAVTILASSELFKQSFDDQTNLQTLFAHYFVEALKSGGGNFPLAMTAEYVWQKVVEASKPLGGQAPVLALGTAQSQTVTIPIGIMVRSSLPQKQIAIGHPIDDLGMNRPDIVPPTSTTTKPGIKLQARNTAAKPAPKPVSAADSDDEDFDPNLDMRPYVAKMKQDIQKRWTAPKGLESRRVTTEFSITRDGKITNAEVVESSGNAEVDKSALAALALPVDPLPKGAPSQISLKYVFDWKTRPTNGGAQ